MIYTTTLETPVGAIHLFATDGGLRYLAWPSAPPVSEAIADTSEAPEHPVLRRASEQLEEYFAGERMRFDIPLDPRGTPFQRAAWQYLSKIPYGATRTYGEQAAAIGRPKASRAVGAANGRNPLSVVVPCHRVIGANGALTGFAGGLRIKRFLLEHEARNADLR